LSGANTSFSEDNNSPHLVFTGGVSNGDRVELYLNGQPLAGNSDFTVQLADNAGQSSIRVANRANTTLFTVSSQGAVSGNTYVTNAGDVIATTADAIAVAIALG
jgi:hypothetical protein